MLLETAVAITLWFTPSEPGDFLEWGDIWIEEPYSKEKEENGAMKDVSAPTSHLLNKRPEEQLPSKQEKSTTDEEKKQGGME